MIALTCVLTMVVRIPTPTKGYLNLGDAAVLLESRPRLGFMLAAPLAELVMVAGYYLYEAAVIGEGFGAALLGAPGNAVQGIVGAAGAYLLIELLGRTEFFRIYGIRGFARRKAK